MSGPTEKKSNPARQFEIEHKSEHGGTERSCVNVPEGASIDVNNNKFIVYDDNNECMLFGYNHVVSFKDVTPKEADDDQG